jgi:hypothetical protein
LAGWATEGRCAQGIAQQVRQFVFVVLKFIDIRLVVAHQIDGQCECAGGIHLVVKIQLAMDGTRFQHLGLQRDANRDELLLVHGATLCESWF